ncbi:MAG: ABC transporter substrate-binding protein [Alphaproteobacteria bacterium]|nr:ABC transporter substrate-binding protein [Alphaproteobacteria bacterium]
MTRVLIIALGLALACSVTPRAVYAQQTERVPRVGYLSGSPPSSIAEHNEAFRRGLRALGHVAGKNIVIEWRSARGKRDHLPALASELVRLKVDVIVTAGPLVTRSVKKATSTIPIVMAQDPDPVGNGFVASLARPGGNITGLARFAPALTGKQMELLQEIVPTLTRVAVFGTSTRPGNAQTLKEVELAAGTVGVKLQYLDILSPKDIGPAFRAAVKERAGGALWFATGSVGNPLRKKIADLAVSSRLPVLHFQRQDVEAGALMSYGVNVVDLHRRAAVYVHKILNGAKPADLPVERASKFDLVINMKTAKALGVTFPPSVLLRADEVIE